MEQIMIEVKKLETSPQNARRTAAKGAAEELKASILAHGLMQNLVVTAAGKGKYRVIAGGRRLAALRALQKDGKLPASHAVPCQIARDEQALELSLAENTVRLAMHPADEFEAFAGLSAQGQSSAQIAERFGVSEKHVLQRLKLGLVAPELLAAYREARLTLDHLMAFAITDDHERQLAVYRGLEEWDSARDIKAMLTGEMPEAKSKLAAFVGLDAYHAAGGVSRADLFGEQIYLESPELLHRLANEKLNGIRTGLESEGWLWVEVSPDPDWSVIGACSRFQPQPLDAPQDVLDRKEAIERELAKLDEAATDDEGEDFDMDEEDPHHAKRAALKDRLDEIDEKLASFVAFAPEQKRVAGCYVSLDHNGKPRIEKGLVRRQDMPKEPKPARTGLPESLKRDLEAYRLQAAQAEIARNPGIAFDLLAFNAAVVASGGRAPANGPEMNLPKTGVPKEPTEAAEALNEVWERLPKAWAGHASEAERFEEFCRLSEAEKHGWLAYYVALSLKPQLASGREDNAYEQALSLTGGNVAGFWRPTRDNYLGRIPRDRLLALGGELIGEQWAQSRHADKKRELAAELERTFAEPEKVAKTPEQLERLKSWLPEGMAFGTADAPPPAKARKRKAA